MPLSSRVLHISLVNEDEGYRFSDWNEPLDDDLTVGDVYRAAQRGYGRCTGKVYVDRVSKPPRHVGWYFVSRQRYEDTNKPYLRGAWITISGPLNAPNQEN